MAIAGTRSTASPGAVIHKRRERFFCADHGQEVEGWAYVVGFGMNKREICAQCWVVTPLPVMRDIGIRRVRWDDENECWVEVE